jgi:hypothetical protein
MDSAPHRRPRTHWMRACAVGMAGLALILLLSGQITWWRLLLALLLLACPAIVIWSALRFGRSDDFLPENVTERNNPHEP